MILIIGVGLLLLALGVAAGVGIDRIRFEPQRAGGLAHLEAVIRANELR